MEPARSPQEPPVYVSPQSREERQLVKELQTITGLEAHVAQRQLRYHEWELQPALAHYLDKGAVTAATSGAHRLLQRLHPNRDARPRAGEAVVRVTAATPSRIEPDLARAAAFARAALGDASLDIVSGASQAARLLFSETGLAPYGSPLALELRRDGAFVAAARVGTAAVAVHGGRVHDVFEIEAFAVAAGERGRGYGQALLAALLLALAAAAPRPVVVVTLPRPQTEGFWKTTLLEWSRGSEGERDVWRALVAEDGAVEFAYPQDAATTLFWSETADRALRAVSPWFVRLAARKAEVTPDQRVADLEAALATVEAERERLAKRIRVLEARRPPAASPVPPSDEDEAGAAPAAIARHLPPVATWPARSPRPEPDDDDAGPAAAASPPEDDAAAAPPPPPPAAASPAPAPPPPDTADDEAIARLLAAEYASPPVHAPPPPVRAAAKRAAAKVAR